MRRLALLFKLDNFAVIYFVVMDTVLLQHHSIYPGLLRWNFLSISRERLHYLICMIYNFSSNDKRRFIGSSIVCFRLNFQNLLRRRLSSGFCCSLAIRKMYLLIAFRFVQYHTILGIYCSDQLNCKLEFVICKSNV